MSTQSKYPREAKYGKLFEQFSALTKKDALEAAKLISCMLCMILSRGELFSKKMERHPTPLPRFVTLRNLIQQIDAYAKSPKKYALKQRVDADATREELIRKLLEAFNELFQKTQQKSPHARPSRPVHRVEAQWYERLVRTILELGSEETSPITVKHRWNPVTISDFAELVDVAATLQSSQLVKPEFIVEKILGLDQSATRFPEERPAPSK